DAKKKIDQIAHDEEVAKKIAEEWEAKEERKRMAEEEATKVALSNECEFIQARIAKFLHDTIAAQRKFLAQQRSAAIRSKPPMKNQLRNQIMAYLKHVGSRKHAELKSKSFDEIKAMYEKLKRFDEGFVAIGFDEDE
ncbi:hypothetical protein Tco_0392116, partial [Tanacetum coccineum]